MLFHGIASLPFPCCIERRDVPEIVNSWQNLVVFARHAEQFQSVLLNLAGALVVRNIAVVPKLLYPMVCT